MTKVATIKPIAKKIKPSKKNLKETGLHVRGKILASEYFKKNIENSSLLTNRNDKDENKIYEFKQKLQEIVGPNFSQQTAMEIIAQFFGISKNTYINIHRQIINFASYYKCEPTFSTFKCRINFKLEKINDLMLKNILKICINGLENKDSKIKQFKISPFVLIENNKSENVETRHLVTNNQITLYHSESITYNEVLEFARTLDNLIIKAFQDNGFDWKDCAPETANFLFDKKVEDCVFVSYRNGDQNKFGENINNYNISLENKQQIIININNLANKYNLSQYSNAKNLKLYAISMNDSKKLEDMKYFLITFSDNADIRLEELLAGVEY